VKKVLGQVNTHLPDALVTQDHLVEIIELGDHVWYVCAKEDKTPMESEQMLYSTLLTVMKEDFGITLKPTPTFTLMEEETVEEMNLCGILKWNATKLMYIHCLMTPVLSVVLQLSTNRIMKVSTSNDVFSPNYILMFYGIIATNRTVYIIL
jgi:hypothetical protein